MDSIEEVIEWLVVINIQQFHFLTVCVNSLLELYPFIDVLVLWSLLKLLVLSNIFKFLCSISWYNALFECCEHTSLCFNWRKTEAPQSRRQAPPIPG